MDNLTLKFTLQRLNYHLNVFRFEELITMNQICRFVKVTNAKLEHISNIHEDIHCSNLAQMFIFSFFSLTRRLRLLQSLTNELFCKSLVLDCRLSYHSLIFQMEQGKDLAECFVAMVIELCRMYIVVMSLVILTVNIYTTNLVPKSWR